MPDFVYILRCSDKTLYAGTAKNLKQRLRLHNQGKGSRYTRARLPVTMVYSKKCKNLAAARRREYQIKTLSRQDKLALIRGAAQSKR